MQMAPVEWKEARTSEKTCIWPPHCESEYTLVPYFLNGESMQAPLETRLEPIVELKEAAAIHEYQSFYSLELVNNPW